MKVIHHDESIIKTIFLTLLFLSCAASANTLTVTSFHSDLELEINTNSDDYHMAFQCYRYKEVVFSLLRGKVFDRIIFPDNTYYLADLHRAGINWRIDWPDVPGESRNNYAVVIPPKGRASYYEFSNVKEGETAQPTSYLNCRKPN